MRRICLGRAGDARPVTGEIPAGDHVSAACAGGEDRAGGRLGAARGGKPTAAGGGGRAAMFWLANVISSAAQVAILFLVRFLFLFTTRLVIRLHRQHRVSDDPAKPAAPVTPTLLFDSVAAKAGGFVDGLFFTDGLDKTRTWCAFALAVASAVVCLTIVVVDVGLVVLGSPRVRVSATTNRPMLLDLAAEGGRPGDVHRPTDSCVQRLRDPHASSTISARTNVVCVSANTEGGSTKRHGIKSERLTVWVQKTSTLEPGRYNATGAPRTGLCTFTVLSTGAAGAAADRMDATVVSVRGETSTLSPQSVGDLAHQAILEYVILPELGNTEKWDEARGVLLTVMNTWVTLLAREESGGASCSAARSIFVPTLTEAVTSVDFFVVTCADGVSLEDGVTALQEALLSHLVLKETTLQDPGGNIVTAVFAKEVERGIPPLVSAILLAVAGVVFCADYAVESKYVSKARFAMHAIPDSRFSSLLYSTESSPGTANAPPAVPV
jgi:hypothetical protein